MFKVIALIPRKPGLTHEEFRNYYESHHAPLAVKLVPQFRGYIRNYISPMEGFEGEPPGYDAVVEFYYDSREVWDEVSKLYLEGEIGEVLIPDEETFMDRSRMQVLIAEECPSDIGG